VQFNHWVQGRELSWNLTYEGGGFDLRLVELGRVHRLPFQKISFATFGVWIRRLTFVFVQTFVFDIFDS
jgi:hypothetical protein